MKSSTSKTMKAFGVDSYKPIGELQHLKEFTVPKPEAPSGHDILVKVHAVATNPIDYKRLANLGQTDEELTDSPLIVGWDAAGVVEAIGPDVSSSFQAGDQVMWAGNFFRPGSFGEYALVDSRIVGRKPSNLTWSQTAALPLTYLTAYEAMVDQLKIPLINSENQQQQDAKKKTILITAGAGGVGSAAIQLAKKVLGLKVIATASRPESIEYVQTLGADHVISHREAYAPQLLKLGLKLGAIDYIMHCSELTPSLFEEFTSIVKPFGGIVCIWPSATVDLMKLFWKSINFSAELMFTRPGLTGKDIQRQGDILTEISQLVEKKILKSNQQRTMSLTVDNLRKALEFQASGKAIGKITLTFEHLKEEHCV